MAIQGLATWQSRLMARIDASHGSSVRPTFSFPIFQVHRSRNAIISGYQVHPSQPVESTIGQAWHMKTLPTCWLYADKKALIAAFSSHSIQSLSPIFDMKLMVSQLTLSCFNRPSSLTFTNRNSFRSLDQSNIHDTAHCSDNAFKRSVSW